MGGVCVWVGWWVCFRIANMSPFHILTVFDKTIVYVVLRVKTRWKRTGAGKIREIMSKALVLRQGISAKL